MAASDIKQIQESLDEAFAQFKRENPAVAEAIQAFNISYVEYLRILSGLNPELHSVSGNIFS